MALVSGSVAQIIAVGPETDASHAAPFPQVPTAFDANYIIADDVFVQANTLSDTAIQQFLDTHGPGGGKSYLATYSINGLTAAQVVGRAARTNNLNPKVLLTKLQVEQSLIGKYSPSNPPSQFTLDYAMGYGCPSACDPAWKGFDVQVNSAAARLRGLFNGDYKPYWVGPGQPFYAGGTLVATPTNTATGVLYVYTPNVGGNQLFWNIWVNTFAFGDPAATAKPANTTFYLPWRGGQTWQTTGGNYPNGHSDNNANRHAWDWIPGSGASDEVVAVASGTVCYVQNSIPDSTTFSGAHAGNVMVIAHEGSCNQRQLGVYSFYAHLMYGTARFSAGQAVAKGAAIARSRTEWVRKRGASTLQY